MLGLHDLDLFYDWPVQRGHQPESARPSPKTRNPQGTPDSSHPSSSVTYSLGHGLVRSQPPNFLGYQKYGTGGLRGKSPPWMLPGLLRAPPF